MNDEQEQATDRAPTEDWAICDRCLKEVPKHRAHSCVKVTIETPDFEVTPERLCSLLYDERRLHKATAARLITSESEVAGLRAALRNLLDEQNGVPLLTREKEYREAIDAARAALLDKLHAMRHCGHTYIPEGMERLSVAMLCTEAADEIERLTAANADLRRKLTASESRLAALERDGAGRLALAVEHPSVDSAQFTKDVAALQAFKAPIQGTTAWNYWHGGIAYARTQAQAALAGEGK